MNKVTIYHNPRCSKSRQTLALLQDKELEIEIIEYLKTPPSTSKLKQILQQLNLPVQEIIRTKEPEYKTLGLDNNKLTQQELIKQLSEHPKLIERPIVLANGKAVIGRPPENIEKLF